MYYEFKDSIKNIVYWSNSAGSLHHNGDYDIDDPKDLPEELQVAFENLWFDGSYLVEFNGQYGVAIPVIYDENFGKTVFSISYNKFKEYAENKAKEYAKKYPELDVIFGDDTIHWSDGSLETDILIICPWNMDKKDFLEISKYVEKTQYNNINAEKTRESFIMEKKQNWLIGIGGSTADDVWCSRVRGTKEQVKQHLLALVAQKKEGWPEKWEYGTEKQEDIEETSPNHFYAYACFSDFHVDFSAELEKEPVEL